jgi:hypothetical protein
MDWRLMGKMGILKIIIKTSIMMMISLDPKTPREQSGMD